MTIARPLALIVTLLAPSLALAGGNWPDFRGPGGQGHVDPASDPPTTWSESEHVKWKTPIHGKAWSSPVVWGEQVWLTTATEDGKQLSVVCVDAKTGKVLLDRKLFDVAEPQFCHPFNSYASPSPVIEDGRVYVTFGSPGTACIDTKTFDTLWTRTDFVCNHFRGAGSSPVLFENLLLMHFDGSDHQFVVALDKTTGKTVWRTERSVDFQDLNPKTGKPDGDGDWRKGFSTPLVAEIAGKPVMLSLGSKAFYCYDPRTGAELWKTVEHKQHSGSNRPVVGPDGVVYTGTGLSKGQLLAIRPGGSGDVTDSHILWRYARAVPTRSSILLVDGLIYMVEDGGVASCVDTANGELVWQQRLGGTYSASPIFVQGKGEGQSASEGGGRIYFFNEAGQCTIFAPGREFKQIAVNSLDAGFMASPAITGNALILRTKTHLYRIEK